MSFFSFNKNNSRTKSKNNKLSFFITKFNMSFLAYELLKKFVISGAINSDKLDFAHPKNWKPRVLKNISPKGMKTFYRLSDIYEKNPQGMICQNVIKKNKVKIINNKFEGLVSIKGKKLSPKAKSLLEKIRSEKPRYENIDILIKKYKVNRAFSN